jgi:hypothetical protein
VEDEKACLFAGGPAEGAGTGLFTSKLWPVLWTFLVLATSSLSLEEVDLLGPTGRLDCATGGALDACATGALALAEALLLRAFELGIRFGILGACEDADIDEALGGRAGRNALRWLLCGKA